MEKACVSAYCDFMYVQYFFCAVYLAKKGVAYLSAGRSQQNINNEIIDRGKIVKRTWRETPSTGISVIVEFWQIYTKESVHTVVL